MSRICSVTGKRPVKGRRIIHRGQSKKSGGIGFQLVKQTKRTSSASASSSLTAR
jgi:large subunit ribosomal protein L28